MNTKLLAPVAALAMFAGSLAVNTALAQPPAREAAAAKDKKDKKDKKKEAASALKVGDAAPAMTIGKWVKGESVTGFEKGKTYVVEFWATWCGPCRRAIPHLTELQKANPDVTIIGVAASERKGLENLEKFVTEQGDKMAYRVAYADDGKMNKAWMEAAGQDGIPTSFVVNGEGKIAWIGHPMELDSHLPNGAKSGKGSDKAKPAVVPDNTDKPADKQTDKQTDKKTDKKADKPDKK